MAAAPDKSRRPSYEDGKLRDPKIAEKLDPRFTKDDMKRLIRKAAPPRRPKT
jgi:hypothetical protein